jgi:hypothetical protein
MATPAKSAPPKAPPAAKGLPGKVVPGKGAAAAKGPAGKGKPAPDAKPDAAAAPAPGARLQKLRLVIFAALGVAMLGTLGVAGWAMFVREPEPVYVDIPPPTPAPPRPTGPVVREGDLRDDLWQRMGVRPQGE